MHKLINYFLNQENILILLKRLVIDIENEHIKFKSSFFRKF